LLTKWNATVNLTGFALDPPGDEALVRLLLEPLAAAPVVEDGPIDWVDLGSGGGSPAIPLKIVRPAARLTMVESKSRKVSFLREAARTLLLADVLVLERRFEDLIHQIPGGSADLVTTRAVRPDETLFAAAAHLLRSTGRLVLFSSPAGAPPKVRGFGTLRRITCHPPLEAELLCFARE
jgi:16S rRNA (guanine527-N7)-methyltransferase